MAEEVIPLIKASRIYCCLFLSKVQVVVLAYNCLLIGWQQAIHNKLNKVNKIEGDDRRNPLPVYRFLFT